MIFIRLSSLLHTLTYMGVLFADVLLMQGSQTSCCGNYMGDVLSSILRLSINIWCNWDF